MSWLAWATGERGVRIARYYFAVWIIPIGLSHLIYAKVTADYVPAWLPYRVGWAYLTGAGQIASGLGVLFGVLPRVAAWAEAGQITVYTLLVWLPAIFVAPREAIALDCAMDLMDYWRRGLGGCSEHLASGLLRYGKVSATPAALKQVRADGIKPGRA